MPDRWNTATVSYVVDYTNENRHSDRFHENRREIANSKGRLQWHHRQVVVMIQPRTPDAIDGPQCLRLWALGHAAMRLNTLLACLSDLLSSDLLIVRVLLATGDLRFVF